MKSFLSACFDAGISTFEAPLAGVILETVVNEKEFTHFISAGEECFYLFDDFTIYSWGDGFALEGPRETAAEALRHCSVSWDDMGFGSEVEQFVAFGVEPEFEEVGERDECHIWVTPNFYSTTIGAPMPWYLCHENSAEPMVFADKKAAQDWIDESNSTIYRGSHGECGRPDYKIVPIA